MPTPYGRQPTKASTPSFQRMHDIYSNNTAVSRSVCSLRSRTCKLLYLRKSRRRPARRWVNCTGLQKRQAQTRKRGGGGRRLRPSPAQEWRGRQDRGHWKPSRVSTRLEFQCFQPDGAVLKTNSGKSHVQHMAEGQTYLLVQHTRSAHARRSKCQILSTLLGKN